MYHPDECYSPMSDPSTTRTLVALSNALDLNIDHLDVAVAYLNGVLPTDVITWNIGPQGVDLSFPLIAQTLSKGAAVVMFQEVSFHPEERRRVKGILRRSARTTGAAWNRVNASQ